MKKRYIAYGSNMDEGQMAYRCPTARLLGQTEVEGYRLLFKGSLTGAYATIEPQEGGRVVDDGNIRYDEGSYQAEF